MIEIGVRIGASGPAMGHPPTPRPADDRIEFVDATTDLCDAFNAPTVLVGAAFRPPPTFTE